MVVYRNGRLRRGTDARSKDVNVRRARRLSALLIGGLGVSLVVSPVDAQERDDRIIREKRKARMEARRVEQEAGGKRLETRLRQRWIDDRAGKSAAVDATPVFVDEGPLLSFIEVAGPARPTFVDLDGDGDLDLTVGSYYGDIVYFENTGTDPSAPAFANAVTDPFGISNNYVYAAPTYADIDADGDFDLIVGDFFGDFSFFENLQIDGGTTGAGPTFGAPVVNPYPILADAYYDAIPVFVDIDDDGDLDLFAGNGYYGEIIFFENEGDPTTASFTASALNPFGLVSVPYYSAPAFADVDGDGDQDLLVGNDDGDLFYFENTGDPSSPAFSSTPVQNPFGLVEVVDYASPTFADIDDDGDFDAIVGNIDGDVLFQRNDDPSTGKDAPTFTPFPLQPFGLSAVDQRSAPTFTDLDGDDDLDALIGERSGDLLYYENTGDPTNAGYSTSPLTNPFGLVDNSDTPIGSNVVPVFVDLNNDGLADVVLGEGSDTFFFENTGSTSAPAFALPVENAFGLSGAGSRNVPAFVDIDDDGDLDYFAGTRNAEIFFQQNTGADPSAPAFASLSSDPFGLVGSFNSWAPAFADIDGDTDYDAWFGTEDGEVVYYENTGDVSNPAFASSGVNPFGIRNYGTWAVLAFADIDANGTLDLFSGHRSGRIAFFRNTTVPDPTGLSISVKIFLEGPYSASGDSMATDISGDIPLSQPYSDAAYSGTSLEYAGTESVGAIPTGVVDWVLVELRTGTPGSQTIEATQAAFLLKDGSIVATDGSSPLNFDSLSEDDYHVVVYQRNHLGVMTMSPVTLSASTTAYDFSSASAQAFGSSPMTEVETDVWALWSGDPSLDGGVTAADFNLWLTDTKAGLTGYLDTDLNMDGGVTAADFNLWLANTKQGASTGVPAPAP